MTRREYASYTATTEEASHPMQSYPLSLSFKMIAISPQVRITDSTGRLIMYVKQKAFKLREDVTIYSDEQQRFELLRMKADRILDIAATYTIRDQADRVVGSVRGQGLRSLWRRSFTIMDPAGQEVGCIKEDNPWVKVADTVIGEIPFLGWIASMFINPAYTITYRSVPTLHLVKKPSFLERHFEVRRLADVHESDEQLLLASLIMMLMLLRGAG